MIAAAAKMNRAFTVQARQYGLALGLFILTSAINTWLHDWIGGDAAGLVYLLSVVVLALFVGRGAILFCADRKSAAPCQRD